MKFVTHPQHNRWMGAPVGWDHSKVHCGSLSIHDKRSESTPLMESAWELEGFEPLSLALGYGQIRLAIYGMVHPPVSQVVYPKDYDNSPKAKLERFNRVLSELTDNAKYHGLMLVGGVFIPAK